MGRSLVALLVGLLAVVPAWAQMPTGPMPGMGGPPPGVIPGEPVPVYQPSYPPGWGGSPPTPNRGSPPPLSGRDPGAFDDRSIQGSEEGFFVNVGGIFLRRDRLGSQVIVQRDPIGVFDTGILPIAADPVLLNTRDVNPGYGGGVRYTVGYRFETDSVELAGYYLFDNTSSSSVTQLSRLNLPFGLFGAPPGFEGNAGLWLQADRVQQSITTRMLNNEINFRRGNGRGGELITGLRYLNLAEIYSLFTDDDSLAFGVPVTVNQANYSVRSQNHIFAPQLGGEFEQLVNPWLAFGFFGKGAWGVNFNEVTGRLERGDGFVFPVSTRNRAQFTHLYEAGAFFNWVPFERLRFKAGYQFLWVANVPEASANINFNLVTNRIGDNPSGDIFYHGPLFELSLAF